MFKQCLPNHAHFRKKCHEISLINIYLVVNISFQKHAEKQDKCMSKKNHYKGVFNYHTYLH